MIIKKWTKKERERGEGSGGGRGGNGSCHNLIKNGLTQPLEYTKIKCKFSHSIARYIYIYI